MWAAPGARTSQQRAGVATLGGDARLEAESHEAKQDSLEDVVVILVEVTFSAPAFRTAHLSPRGTTCWLLAATGRLLGRTGEDPSRMVARRH